jgi:molybdenum cofactor cytidylyltransferase
MRRHRASCPLEHSDEGGAVTGGEAFDAIVLAAGFGSRFGGGKLTAPFGDGVLLHGAVRAALAAPVRGVTVVTGAEAETVGAALRDFDVRIVHAPDHAEGMGASLRTAIASLAPDSAGAFVFLGDMPRVPQAVLEPMAEAVRGGALAAAPVFAARRGNPVLLSRDLYPQLLALTGDTGARAVLQGLGDRLVLIDAPDDGVLFDVDERSQLG